MSKRKILSALKKKGIVPLHIEYVRGDVVPEGYANGWDIEFSDEDGDLAFDLGFVGLDGFMQFDTTQEVLEYIDKIPKIR